MKIEFNENLHLEFFQLEELKRAEQYAEDTNGVIFSWKTTGNLNWLEKGMSIVDVLGITVLPKDSPDWIDLPDDAEDE